MRVLTAYRGYDKTGNMQGQYFRWNTFEKVFENNSDYLRIEVPFEYGPNCIQNSKELNDKLLNTEYDLAIVNEEKNFTVSLDVAKKLGKKLFLVVADTEISIANDLNINFRVAIKRPRNLVGHSAPLIEYAQYCNVLVADYGYGEIYPNFYSINFPLDPDIYFYDQTIEKNLNLSHNGNMFIPERHLFADIFKKANLDVFYSRSVRDDQIHNEIDYAYNYKRSKISLCFNQSIFGPQWRQRKSRIYEIASCGSLLMMTHPEVLKHKNGTWFTEDEHFISIDKNNCVDKIKYYLENHDKRIKITGELYDQYVKLYSPKVWWNNLFSLVN